MSEAEALTHISASMPSFMRETGITDCPGCGKPDGGRRVMVGRGDGELSFVLSCESCVEASEAAAAEAERQERVRDLLSSAGGTPRLEQFTFDSYPDDAPHKAALRAVTKWRDAVLAVPPGKPGAPNLLLFGNVGGGKTGLVWPCVRAFCEHLRRARYVDFPALLEQMKESYSKRVPFDEHSSLGRVPVLVLDDVGAERPTEWARGELLQLVNQRYERLLPTAYVSNYEPDELIERLGRDELVAGERIVSRMTEGAIQHRLKASDLRL